MTRSAFLAASLAAAVLAAPVAFAGPDGDGPCRARRRALAEGRLEAGPGARDGLGARRGERLRRHRLRMEARAGTLASRLGLTDEQQAAVKQAREATAKTREDVRAALRALFGEARRGDRTEATRAALREKAKSIRASAREAAAPEARKLLATVTPEQRARWAEAAARRGKTLDDERMQRRLERLLLRPGPRHGPR